MNPGDSSWWWSHAFDAVASGLVTALAVWLTLRHERRRGEGTDLRNEVAAMEALIWELTRTLGGADRGSWRDPAFRLWSQVLATAAAARGRYPLFAQDLDEALSRWEAIIDADDGRDAAPVFASLKGLLGGLIACSSVWKNNRKKYVRHNPSVFE